MVSEGRIILKVEHVSLSFGELKALSEVSIDVREGEILAIIGPNGAGKTCLLNCISGYYKPQQGQIYMNGKSLVGLPNHERAQLGIARTFQNIELFTGLTVLNNLLASRHVHYKHGFLPAALYFGWTHDEEIKHRRVVEDIIDLLEIESSRNKVVGVLPYGIRKRVELGRALALEPKVLLLDEPMSGMNIEEKEDMVRFIIDVFEGASADYEAATYLSQGINTMVLIEHDMGVVMDIADRVVVLDFGIIIADGTPAEIKLNPRVIKAYLGEEEA